jgi:hypothetical protein
MDNRRITSWWRAGTEVSLVQTKEDPDGHHDS